MFLSAVLSLFGCKAQVLDGPGMVNKAQWTAFTLSRNDSYAQYNFSFTVKDSDYGAFVTGFCRDEDGNIYENENGIPVPIETITAIRSLGIDDLNDIPQNVSEDSSETEDPMLAEVLDEGPINLSVVYYTDLNINKSVTSELSIEIYKILLPLFIQSGTE